MSEIKNPQRQNTKKIWAGIWLMLRAEPPEPGSEGYSSVLGAITKYHRLADL